MFIKAKIKILHRMYDAIKGNPVTSQSENLRCENGLLIMDICQKMDELYTTTRLHDDMVSLHEKLWRVKEILEEGA